MKEIKFDSIPMSASDDIEQSVTQIGVDSSEDMPVAINLVSSSPAQK